LYALTRQPNTTSDIIQLSFRLLERMVAEARKNAKFRLNTKHLNIVLDKWRIGTRYNVVDRNQYSAPKVLSLIDDFITRIPSLHPDTKTYALIMAVQIKLDPLRSPRFCTDILNRMDAGSSAPPNTIVLTHLMDAHVRSQQKDSSLAVLTIFDHMADSEDPRLAPNEKSLTRVLQALLTSGWTPEEVMSHMNRILDRMVHDRRRLPNSLFLNLALSFADSGYPKKRASAPLLADALMTVVEGKAKGYPHIAPDAAAYGTIINILSKSEMGEAPARAEHWLRQMMAASKNNQKLVPPPRASLYTSVISSWERSGLPEAPRRGEAVFQEMLENTPSTTAGAHYLLISLWSKSDAPEATAKAEKLLRQMITKSKYSPKLSPSLPAFVNVISCWKRSGVPDAPHKAQAVLDLLLEEHTRQPLGGLNDVPFNATINAWATSGFPEAEMKVDAILSCMNDQAKNYPSVAPSIVTAWSAMQCLSSQDAPSKALKLLEMMDNDQGNKNQHLRGRLYEGALKIWNSCLLLDAPQQSERILRHYLRQPNKHRNLVTTKTCFKYVLESWKNSSLPEASKRLELVLEELEKEAELVHKRGSNVDLYAFLAQAWAKSGLLNAEKRVKEVLDIIIGDRKIQDRRPELAWFSDAMHAFAELGDFRHMQEFLERVRQTYHQAADENQITNMYFVALRTLLDRNETDGARKVLEVMIDVYNDGDLIVKPTARYFGPVMLAYAKAGNFEMVESLWSQLQRLQSENNMDPDFYSDATLLAALCQSHPRHAIREYSILYHLLERSRVSNEATPNEDLVYSVLDSLVQSGKSSAGQHAEMILLKMQELHEEGRMAQPTFQAFQKVIDCWVLSDMEGATERAERVLHFAEALSEDGDNHLKPTYEGYAAVIKAWSNSCLNDAPERIQRHIRKTQQRFENGEQEFKPGGHVYSALIMAYANSGRDDAALMAQTVFDNTPAECRNTNLFNALIAAQGGDALQAESILNRMHEEFLNGDSRTKPNTQTFNNLISSWSKSGSPMAAWRADSVFQRMEQLGKSGQLDIKPDGETFDIVIATLSNDWGADAARKVDRYLELLKQYYRSGASDCMPSVASYTAAIRAWGSNVDDPRAVLRAKALLDEMHELAGEGAESVKPNQDTYLVYLKALSQSAVDGKEELAKDVLSSMKQNGVEPDGALLSEIQRCSLPIGVAEASWTIPIEEKDADEFPSSMLPTDHDPLGSRLQSSFE
jgi:tetratricopeptide (TPR) repeat protein